MTNYLLRHVLAGTVPPEMVLFSTVKKSCGGDSLAGSWKVWVFRLTVGKNDRANTYITLQLFDLENRLCWPTIDSWMIFGDTTQKSSLHQQSRISVVPIAH